MISDLNIVLILLLFIIIIFVFLFFLNNHYSNNKKFINYFHILTSFGTLLLGLTFLTAVVDYRSTKKVTATTNFSLIAKDFSEGIINLFIEHPEMNYFYEEIFYGKKNFRPKRNILLENQICTNIFIKCVEPISIINIYGEEDENVKPIKEALLKFLSLLFQSSKVKNFYIYYFKPNLGGPILIEFIEKKFGF